MLKVFNCGIISFVVALGHHVDDTSSESYFQVSDIVYFVVELAVVAYDSFGDLLLLPSIHAFVLVVHNFLQVRVQILRLSLLGFGQTYVGID